LIILDCLNLIALSKEPIFFDAQAGHLSI